MQLCKRLDVKKIGQKFNKSYNFFLSDFHTNYVILHVIACKNWNKPEKYSIDLLITFDYLLRIIGKNIFVWFDKFHE